MKKVKYVLGLAITDQKTRYASSVLGFLWAFIKPIFIISLFIFVFENGLRVNPSGEEDNFTLWLICGMIPWFFFSEAIASATNSIFEYGFLVKKMKFDSRMIPMIKILSTFIIHMFFIYLLTMYAMTKVPFNVNFILVFYYLFASFMIVVSISYFTASFAVFVPDMRYLVDLVLQLMFWITPIFWNYQELASKFNFMLKYNPFFYVIEGYRNIFVYNNYTIDINQAILFWVQTTVAVVVGMVIFNKLSKHFVELL